MKKILLTAWFIGLMVTTGMAQSDLPQKYQLDLNGTTSEMRLTINLNKTNLKIEGHSQKSIIVEAKGYKAPPKRADGLVPLYSAASDNTGLGLYIETAGNQITMEKASRREVDYTIKIPMDLKLTVNEGDWLGERIEISNLSSEIEINAKGADISLQGIKGPVVASTNNGEIVAVFTELSQKGPSSFKCTNGYVDVTMPEKSKANVKMRSVSGEIFTNFAVEVNEQSENKKNTCDCGGYTIEGKINSGGAEVNINAINDNIYLRKK